MNRHDLGASNGSPASRDRVEPPFRRIGRALLLGFLLWAAWTATYALYTSPDRVTVIVGEPSPRQVKAPRSITYVSQVKTNEARAAAAARVQEVFTGPDMRIASEQLRTLARVINQISAIREETAESDAARVVRLQEMQELRLASHHLTAILELTDEDWRDVSAEALRVLDLAIRQEIRPGQILEARRYVERLTTFALPDEERAIVIALAQSMVVPNSFPDTEATEASREAARNGVEPVHWTIREGQSLLR
ncbi:MAG: hypothetical protein FJZ90_08770, partial [Chloroflexi bacterium]|nr:hypothetical protein [Chloroflexota bacterium]